MEIRKTMLPLSSIRLLFGYLSQLRKAFVASSRKIILFVQVDSPPKCVKWKVPPPANCREYIKTPKIIMTKTLNYDIEQPDLIKSYYTATPIPSTSA